MGVELADQLQHRFHDAGHPLGGEQAALHVHGSQPERLQDDLVVIGRQRTVPQHLLRLRQRLVAVPGKDALVKALDRCECRPVPQDDVQELQRGHVAAHDHQAQGEWGGQDQPDRAPQPRPENGGDHDRNRGQPRAVAINQRLDYLADRQLHHRVQRHRPDHGRPSGIDPGGQRDREQTGKPRADIRHEAQQRPGDAPQHRARNAQDGEPQADHAAEPGVDAELRKEVAAQSPASVVQRDGGAVEVVGAEQTDEAVAQVVLLQQHEDRHHEHDGGVRERREHGRQDLPRELQRRERRFLHLHQRRFRAGRRRGAARRGAWARAWPVAPAGRSARSAPRCGRTCSPARWRPWPGTSANTAGGCPPGRLSASR